MKHWAEQYLTIKHERGGNGPDAYDCLHFTSFICKKHFNTDVPAADFSVGTLQENIDQIERSCALWVEIEGVNNWREGDVIIMARSRVPVHIGVLVVDGRRIGVLHCFEPAGVVYQSFAQLRTVGWGRLRAYRPPQQ